MSQTRFISIFVSLVLVSILVNTSTFLVRGIEQVVIVRLGSIAKVIDNETGLYLKWPVLDEVVRLDKRVMSLTSDAIRVPTSGNEFITVATVAQWRIADPIMFIRTAKTEAAGASLLGQILDAAVRSQAAQLSVDKIISGALVMTNCSSHKNGCATDPQSVATEIALRVHQYGIELKDFRVLGVWQTQNVREQVENRMNAERLNAAERIYADGETTSAQISAEAELKAQKILSDAQQYHDDFLAAVDREILNRFTVAYGEDQDLYAFFETMNAYKRSFGPNATLMVPANSEFFRFLQHRQ